jgi:hypothetical protein
VGDFNLTKVKTQWTIAAIPLDSHHFKLMKCDTTNAVLTFVLGVLAVATVICAARSVILTREFRSLSMQVSADNNSILEMRALVNDVGLYNQKSPNPELTKLLQVLQVKPVTH